MIAVLLIDDEPAILRSMARLLLKLGVEATTVSSRDEALEIAGRCHFDVVLCDCNMPGMSGDDFLTRLAHDHPTLERRVIFTSGDLEDAETVALVGRCGHPGLAKPFDAKTLLAAIKDVASTSCPAHA